MSKEKRRLEKAKQMIDVYFKKPDHRTTAEKITDMRAKREAADNIGRNPGGNKRKK